MTHRWSGGVDSRRRRRNVYDKKPQREVGALLLRGGREGGKVRDGRGEEGKGGEGRGGKGGGREGKGRREERERGGRLLFQTF